MPTEGEPHTQAVTTGMAEASTEPLSLTRVAVVGDKAKLLATKMAEQRQLEFKVARC